MDEIATSTIGDALYSEHHRCWDACQDPDDPYGRSPTHRCYGLTAYPITKVTERRIYFVEARGGVGYDRPYFIERAKFDELANAYDEVGRAYHRGLREYLYLTPDALPRWRRQEDRIRNLPTPKTLSELKRAMAEAHPDVGGSDEAFIAARRRYVEARRARGGA